MSRRWEGRTHKTCKRCGEEKPLADFYKTSDGRWKARCKPCHNQWVYENRMKRPEEHRARRRAAYAATKYELKRYRERFEADPEAMRAKWREDYRRDPERFKELAYRRRARVAGVERQPYGRDEIFKRDSGICRGCGEVLTHDYEIDHIVPISLGGVDTPANVQLMCPPCNRRKAARLEGQIHLPV